MTVIGRFGAERWPRWLWVVLPTALLVVLAWTGVLWWQSFHHSAETVPGVPWSNRPGERSPTYRASIFGLLQPMGVAVSPNGQRIYVTNTAGDREVAVFDVRGDRVGALAPPGTDPSMRALVYVAVNSQGNVFVTDREQSKLFVFDADGTLRGTFPPSPPADWHPLGVTIDAEDNVYVTDVTPDKHRVLVFGPDGTLKLEFGKQGHGQGEFWFPNAVAIDAAGRIYVADSNNGRVQIFQSDGSYLTEVGHGLGSSDLQLPRGLAIDPAGRLYIVDTSRHTIAVFQTGDDGPAYLGSFGSRGIGDGEFFFPNGIAAYGSDRLYITDRENGRVQIWGY